MLEFLGWGSAFDGGSSHINAHRQELSRYFAEGSNGLGRKIREHIHSLHGDLENRKQQATPYTVRRLCSP